jgi:hypothetical protein
MNNRRVLVWSILAVCAAASAASAQTSYVSASLFGDVVRTSHSSLAGGDGTAGGETLGFALRIGTPVGSAWGVEAEFARPGEIDGESDVVALPALEPAIVLPGLDRDVIGRLVPSFQYRYRTSQRHTTLTASVWAQQVLTARFSLVYLGGLGFYRSERDLEIGYSGPLPVVLPSISSETISYGVRPMAGFEARISLSDHAYINPGIRLHGIDNGWLVRPAVGLGWAF